jgi:hypothetical protein
VRAGDALVTHIPIHGEVLKGTALGLWNEEGGEDASKHESGEDLHDVVEPWAWVVRGGVTTNAEGRDGALSDNRTNLSGAG